MRLDESLQSEHLLLTRRYFLGLAAAGLSVSALADAQLRVDLAAPQGATREYLTKQADFGTVERGNPPPYQLPEAKLREIGMVRDTWRLEVIADAGAKLDNPLTRERGNALDWAAFMKLAETKSVRFLKVITCNNLNSP